MIVCLDELSFEKTPSHSIPLSSFRHRIALPAFRALPGLLARGFGQAAELPCYVRDFMAAIRQLLDRARKLPGLMAT